MVAAAHPLAVEAGLDILKQGGSAVDAAVAVQAVLGLVEPESSGLGGGAFMLYWDAEAAKLEAYDGRETAPASVTPTLFLDDKGQPLEFYSAAKTGRAVGVPGVVSLLTLAREDHGKLPWAKLLQPAIRLAEHGFEVTPGLHDVIASTPALDENAPARALYFDADGQPLAAGTLLKNPAYAVTLKDLAAKGPRAFYEGPIAQGIVATVTGAPRRPGGMTLADLANYTAKRRAPLCAPYHDEKICTMPPPSGGVTLLEIMKLLEPTDLASLHPASAEAVHLFSEASALSYVDRDRYVGDPDHVAVPVQGLLDAGYLDARRKLIDRTHHAGAFSAGTPPGAQVRADTPQPEVPSTSHFVIVDKKGNIVSMTTTVEADFGSNLMTGGFILNNQLTDFSFLPTDKGKPVANAVAPGKRPRSAMSPAIVFDGAGKPILAIGSPGGARIISYVAQSLVNRLDWKLPLQEAVARPHHIDMNKGLELEQGSELERLKPALEAMGHTVTVRPLHSGLHGIALTPNGLEGAADPRREGAALGLGSQSTSTAPGPDLINKRFELIKRQEAR